MNKKWATEKLKNPWELQWRIWVLRGEEEEEEDDDDDDEDEDEENGNGWGGRRWNSKRQGVGKIAAVSGSGERKEGGS